jgi:hypothetical protein
MQFHMIPAHVEDEVSAAHRNIGNLCERNPPLHAEADDQFPAFQKDLAVSRIFAPGAMAFGFSSHGADLVFLS